jgi:hypothetical protein
MTILLRPAVVVVSDDKRHGLLLFYFPISPPPPKKKRFDVTKKKKMLSGVTDNAPNNSKKWTGEIQGGCTVAHGVSFLADLLVGSKKWRDDADEC